MPTNLDLPQSALELLAAVQAAQQRFNYRLPPPLSPAAQQVFSERTAYTFAYELPAVYRAILAVADGLDWNGHLLYASGTRLLPTGNMASQGLVETNIQLRLGYTPNKNFIYFAEGGMDAYRHNLLNNQFEVADRIATESIFETFTNADGLFQYLFKSMLNVGDEADDSAI